jgi:glycosyltransferase involved in cell wall biosynthesis
LRFDIVIPAHNEEERIGRTLDAYRVACPEPDTHFLVALDDCTDATADIVREHAARDPRVESYSYPKLGKGGVIMETFRRSDADLVGFVDADCATPPGELRRLAEVARHADGAIACRNHPASVLPAGRTLARRITSAGFAFGVRRLLGLPFADTQCGAKVLRRDVARDVLPQVTARDFLFDVDLLLAAEDRGHRIVEVPTIWIDQAGSRVDPVADTRRMGASLLRLWLARKVRAVHAARRRGPAAEAVEVMAEAASAPDGAARRDVAADGVVVRRGRAGDGKAPRPTVPAGHEGRGHRQVLELLERGGRPGGPKRHPDPDHEAVADGGS